MTNNIDRKSIAVIGLGNMGSALAKSLLSAKYPVTVWNRSPDKAKPFSNTGAIVASDPTAAAASSDILIVCLTNHDAFVSVIHNDQIAKSLEDKTVMQLGVVTADQSRQTSAWMNAHGIRYLEASILGIPKNIFSATATLVCAGPRSLYDACLEIFAVFGNSHLVSEEIGSACDFDKVYYSFAYASLLGYIQGAALAEASGYSIDAYTDLVAERLPKISVAIKDHGEHIARRNHEGDQASLKVWADGYAKSLELCRSVGVDDTLPGAVMQNLEKAISAGYQDQGITAVLEVLLPAK